MTAKIHPSAIVGKECELADGVEIGPFCVLEGKVSLGEGTRLLSHVTMLGPVTVGRGTTLYPGSAIGFPPQDYKFKPGMPTAGVKIGDGCLLRESTTVHAASKMEHPTTLGDRVFMMVNSHVGHDTVVCNDAILINGALLAGHVHMGEKATVSGNSAIHQFCRLGRMAFVTGTIGVSRDVPPFFMVGARNRLVGINAVGMRRNGFARVDIGYVREAFRRAFRVNLPREEMISILHEIARVSDPVREIAEFVATSKRGVLTARRRHDEGADDPVPG
jgi:UDP-N-acetylglucosamine acyltransferase